MIVAAASRRVSMAEGAVVITEIEAATTESAEEHATVFRLVSTDGDPPSARKGMTTTTMPGCASRAKAQRASLRSRILPSTCCREGSSRQCRLRGRIPRTCSIKLLEQSRCEARQRWADFYDQSSHDARQHDMERRADGR